MPFSDSTISSEVLESSTSYTIAECASTKSKYLNLAASDAETWSNELKALVHLQRLNLNENPLTYINVSSLPAGLVHLSLTGCDIRELPASIVDLKQLQILDIGANSITNIDILFKCLSLVHIGCAYNSVSSLPTESPTPTNIVSMDLSHNAFADITTLQIGLLTLAPKIQSLHLTGNPICLIPRYEQIIHKSFKSLKFLDGIKQDILGGAACRPGSTSVTPRSSSSGCMTGLHEESWNLKVELSSLTPAVDPFAAQKALMDEWLLAMASLAPEKGKGKAEAPPPPPQPTTSNGLPLQPMEYCVELSIDGVDYATLPLVLHPPRPPTAPPVDAKKAAPASKPAAKGKGAVEEVVAPPAPELPRGSLLVTLPIRADLKWRDFLRRGLDMRLICTRHEAVAEVSDLSQQDQKPVTPPVKGGGKGGKGKGEAEAPPPPPPFRVVSSQSVAGTASFSAAKLVTGRAISHEGTAAFIPIPALWDGRGIRLGLEDPSQDKAPVATIMCKFSLSL